MLAPSSIYQKKIQEVFLCLYLFIKYSWFILQFSWMSFMFLLSSLSLITSYWKADQKLIQNWRVLRGDNVMIIRGKDKGETGVIKRVVRSQNRVTVEGKNLHAYGMKLISSIRGTNSKA